MGVRDNVCDVAELKEENRKKRKRKLVKLLEGSMKVTGKASSFLLIWSAGISRKNAPNLD